MTTSGPPVLEASNLAVGWGGRPIVEDVHLTVGTGERIALLGANGSGKTTLMRVLAGLAPALRGEVRWGGGELPRGPARPRLLGLVFQSEAPSHFTVRELVTLGLGLRGPPSSEHAIRVERILDEEGLAGLADRRCSTLSGGEWQRCMLARALVAGPRLLLLDEPTNHLDPPRRAALHDRLARLAEQAVVLATHDLELASLCDRVVLLGRGRVTAAGRPSDVLTPEGLAGSLGVRVRRVEDVEGPLFRILGSAAMEAS